MPWRDREGMKIEGEIGLLRVTSNLYDFVVLLAFLPSEEKSFMVGWLEWRNYFLDFFKSGFFRMRFFEQRFGRRFFWFHFISAQCSLFRMGDEYRWTRQHEVSNEIQCENDLTGEFSSSLPQLLDWMRLELMTKKWWNGEHGWTKHTFFFFVFPYEFRIDWIRFFIPFLFISFDLNSINDFEEFNHLVFTHLFSD